MINANFHTHTTYCDGHDTPRAFAEKALKLGFTALGYSGHMGIYNKLKDSAAYKEEIRALEAEYADRLEILCGIELDGLYDPACAEGWDYVIGSTHFVKGWNKASIDTSPAMTEEMCRDLCGGDYYKLAKLYFETEAGVADRIRCDFIGHFDLLTKFNDVCHFYDETDPRFLGPAFEAMEYLVTKGLPFEMNTGQFKRGGRIYLSGALLKRLHELGGEIMINSDCHRAGDLALQFDLAAEMARVAGFDHTNFLTKKNGRLEYVQVGL